MEKRLITAKEIVSKYGVDQTAVSLALSAARVEPADYVRGKRGGARMYDEEKAKDALKALYQMRKRRYLQKAAVWHGEMLAVDRIFEEGGERCDYIGPVNGRLGLEEQMEREMGEME